MASSAQSTAFDLRDEALARERSRLVGLCASLTHDLDVAEDLAQETLYEAWTHRHRLRERERYAEWLSGIARNVCRRWWQRQQREAARLAAIATSALLHGASCDGRQQLDSLEALPDDLDLEAELEREELAALLDRAMALLPAETTSILVGRYVDQTPHAEMAQRLGLSEGAVKVRLHRGKLALRRLLLAEFAESAHSYGLAPSSGGWEETRLWCTFCGERRLLGRLRRDTPDGEFVLRCPTCSMKTGMDYHRSGVALLGGVTRYKSALARIATWADGYFRPALRHGLAPCQRCGRSAPLVVQAAAELPLQPTGLRILLVSCAACGIQNTQSLSGLALSLPEGQAFWRAHPRIRMLPEREVETQGRAAFVHSFQSVADGARLDIISARDTYEVLRIHHSAGA
jgi:RNA polymerase sigma-70 factor (ECF subfamily)